MIDKINWKTVGLILLVAVGAAGAATIAGTPLTQNDDGVVLNQPGGPQATLTGDVTIYNDSGGLSDSSIYLHTDAGTATFYATGDANVTASAFDLEGTYTNTTDIEASTEDLTIEPADKSNFTISGTVDRLDFRDASVDDGATDVYLDGAGIVTISPSGLPASTTVYAVDSATGQLIDHQITDASGQAYFDVQLDTGQHVVGYPNGDLKQTWTTNDRSIRFVTQSPTTTTPAYLDANSGPNVTLEAGTQLETTDPFPYSNTVNIDSAAGDLEVISNGDSSLTVNPSNLEGTYTKISTLDATTYPIQLNPGDKKELTIDGDATSIEWQDYAVDDGQTDIIVSAPSGSSLLTLNNLPASTAITAINKSLGSAIDVVNTDASGQATISVQHSTQNIILQSGDQSNEPEQSNPEPTGDLSVEPSEVSIDIADRDFVEGDTVDVAFSFDGSHEVTKTVSSNGTVTTSIPSSALTGGQHDWTVETTDDFGKSITQTYSYRTPDTLYVRNELTEDLLNTVSIELQFYSQENDETAIIETRSASDGTFNLTGLPIDDPIVGIAAADGFYDRRITIRSVYDQETIYLLDNTTETARPTFVVNDYTGKFPSETTVLEVQRSINDTYKTVYGDFLGTSDELPTQLQYNTRHRIRLYNAQTGASRVVGTTMATATVEKQIDVFSEQDPEITGVGANVEIGPDTQQLAAAEDTTISVQYAGAEDDDWSVDITYQNDTIQKTLATESYTGPQSDSINLNLSQYSGGEVVVNASHPGGWNAPVYSVERVYGTEGILGVITSLTPALGGESGGITSLIAVMVTLFGTAGVAATIGASANAIGLTALTGLAAFSVIGWIPYGIVFAGAVGWAAIVALREGL